MAYPTTDWPGALDAAITRVDLVNTVWANDFNYPDGQIRSVQAWLGAAHGDLIGDDGTVTHGPGGMVSPIADGGTAFKFAARDAYTGGTLFSVGDDEDLGYVEKFAIEATGLLSVAGVTNYETLVLADDDIPNKKYTDDAIATAVLAEDFWDRAGGIITQNTPGDLLSIAGPGTSDIILERTDTHGDAKEIGYLTFEGRADDASDVDYSRIVGYAVQDAIGSEYGEVQFYTRVGGGWAERGAFGGGFMVGTGLTDPGAGNMIVSGDLEVGAGVVGAPSIAIGANDTGIFRESAAPDVLAFVGDGAKVASLSAAQMLNVDGTVGAPGYGFTSESGLGWWRSAAGTMALAKGGATLFSVDDTRVWSATSQSFRMPIGAGVVGSPTYSFQDFGDTGNWLESTSPDVLAWSNDGTKTANLSAAGFALTINSQQFLAQAGAVGAPAWAFLGHPDTGGYLESATPDVIAWSANGVKVLSISAAQMLNVDGTIGAPAYSFISDPTSGMRWSGTTIRFVVGGVRQTTIDNTNMTGNAASSYSIRHALGTESLPTYNFKGFVDTGMWLISTGPDLIGFSCDGTLAATIDATGITIPNIGNLIIGSTAVVGVRQTGWTAPTGNVSRGTFDPATVTLAQLGERVHALIDDLTTHGMIGA